MRFLSDLPNVVTSFPYRPRHASWLTVHLVMELMEVRNWQSFYDSHRLISSLRMHAAAGW